MTASLYITGTDTGIGKTHISCALIRALRSSGVDALGMKPVASGCESSANGLRNADALALIAASATSVAYEDVNPYAFADPIAPHLAAADDGVAIDRHRIIEARDRLSRQASFLIVEGVGGWLAPLGDALMQADVVRALEAPVVLVVGLRLGCLNHALLSARAITSDGCRLVGWIANRIDIDMLRVEDNIATLRERIHAPLLGIVEHAGDSRIDNDGNTLDDAVRILLAHAGT